MVAQKSVTKTWLTTVVTSRKSERPKTTPSTERHQTYVSPRRICGYEAPSGGRTPLSAIDAGEGAAGVGLAGWRFATDGDFAGPAAGSASPDARRDCPTGFVLWSCCQL